MQSQKPTNWVVPLWGGLLGLPPHKGICKLRRLCFWEGTATWPYAYFHFTEGKTEVLGSSNCLAQGRRSTGSHENSYQNSTLRRGSTQQLQGRRVGEEWQRLDLENQMEECFNQVDAHHLSHITSWQDERRRQKNIYLNKFPHCLATSRCSLSLDSPSWKVTESGDNASEFFLQLTPPLTIPLFVSFAFFRALTILWAQYHLLKRDEQVALKWW